MKAWRCYHYGCGRAFVHARYLVAHLIDIHGEGAAR